MSNTSRTSAAQYLRMSTDRQELSIPMQIAGNAAFALEHGYEIVKTYSDEGISGLGIEKRLGLKRLLADVIDGDCGFSAVIVFDISRWGRFQNPDQAAHYEFLCNEAGVSIEYSTEAFSNDGSVVASVMKSIKRAMASEYSRDLSRKISWGRRNVAARGLWGGGSAGYGFRRELVSRDGRPAGVMEFGEHKALQGYRVRLVLGPTTEIETVRRMYLLFAKCDYTSSAIAELLNGEGTFSEGDAPWTGPRVRAVLTNPRYVGDMVRGKFASHLGRSSTPVPEKDWVRQRKFCPPIVSRAAFAAVESEMSRRQQFRPSRASSDRLIQALRGLLAEKGRLSNSLVSASPDTPSIYCYVRRFGSLSAAFRLAGYVPTANQVRMSVTTQALAASRTRHQLPSDTEMLAALADLYAKEGRLSKALIRDDLQTPHVGMYSDRFGGMRHVYALVGYEPTPHQEKAFRRHGGQAITAEEAALIRQAGKLAAND